MTNARLLGTDLLTPVRRHLLSLLRCPHDGSPLHGWNSLSAEGTLTSTDSGRAYPVIDGVPCLLPDALREPSSAPSDAEAGISDKQSEMAARDAQAGDYDNLWGLKVLDKSELPLSLRFLGPESDDIVLEGGCGTGRMTAMFAERCKGLIAIDFSMESIRSAQRKLPPALRDRVLFVQADLCHLPLATEAFDRVGSFGVYQHLPTEQTRKSAMGELARVVKPARDGGRFAYSAYRWNRFVGLFAQREGHHAGGIYYRRYTRDEFKAQAAPHFRVTKLSESMQYYHILSGEKD